MDVTEVLKICHDLSEEGKNLSVALVKGRMTRGTPLPVIIAGIKKYQASPKKAVEQMASVKDSLEPSNLTASLESKVEKLIAHVAKLESEVEALNVKVEGLTHRLNARD